MSQTVKVGIFMTVALAVLAYLIIKVEDVRVLRGPGERVEAVFDSVAGLDDKAPVRVAGVRVGRVDGIRLEGRRAVVSMLLDRPVPLTDQATASIVNLGLLGDKFVQLTPGPPDGAPLAAGALIPGSSPVSIDEAIGRFSRIGESLESTLSGLGPEETGATLRELLGHLERTSAVIEELVVANRGEVGATVANFERFSATLADELPRLTRQMERTLEQVEALIAENRGGVHDGLESLTEVARRARVSVDNLNEISTALARGEGTLGKLLHSDETHDRLVSTLTSLETGVQGFSRAFETVRKAKLDLAFDSYYLEDADDYRPSFSVTIDPESDRFYRLGVVEDPRGRVRTKTEVTTVTDPDGVSRTTTVERLTREEKVTLSAQVGFERGPLQLRAGLFESTGGAAVDYGLFRSKLWLSLEAFDFGREEDLDPRLRVFGKWLVHPNIYLLGGVDDLLVSERESIFFGAGFRWSDDDLKYLIGSLPAPGF